MAVGVDPGSAAPPTPEPPGWGGLWKGRRLVLTAVGVVAIVALLFGLLLGTSSTPGVQRLKPFTLGQLGGGAPVRYPVGGGGPVALTFFASWCTNCRTDLPVFSAVARAEILAGSRVHFIAVDGNDVSRSAGLAFARAHGVTFPIGWDFEETVATGLGLPGLPDTVFVDRSGKVVHIIEGDAPGQFSPAILRHWVAAIASS